MTKSKYTEKDFRRIGWDEYGELMEKILKELQDYISRNNIKIDAVVPILRGGATLGNFLAYKLGIIRILPVQYKYFFTGRGKAELRQLLFTPNSKVIGENPTFLLVEGDQCFGNTVIHAAKDLKTEFPGCNIIHVADILDYSYRDSAKEYVNESFYGKYTNHCEELSDEECKKLGIEGATIAPWENFKEEIAIMEGKEFEYMDGEKVRKNSKKKQDFKF